MIAQPYWITKNLAIVPRPRGGDWLDDEMLALRNAGVDVVVSMLEDNEAAEVGLAEEHSAANRAGLLFLNCAIQDRSIPANKRGFEECLSTLEAYQAIGKRVGIHCRVCIGRASVTSASLLIRSGIAPEIAWKQIAVARGCEVPDTPEQREWVNHNMRTNV